MSYGGPSQPVDSYAQSFIGHPSDPNVGLPPGWIARWDQNTQHWYYVDTSTGRSVWERPIVQQAYAPPPPPPPPQQQPVAPQAGYHAAGGEAASYYTGSSGTGGYAHDDHFDDKGYHKNWSSHQDTYTEPTYPKPSSSPKPPKKHSNWGKYAALGLGALGVGVLGGAVLDHEGNEIENWAGNEVNSVEQGIDDFKDDIENAPENAAGWVGNKVGEVEGEYDDVKDDIDDAKDDIEDIPEDVAGWTGEQVGKVEEFGDDVEEAYDEGRDEGREESSSSSDDGGDDGDDDDDGGDDDDDDDDDDE